MPATAESAVQFDAQSDPDSVENASWAFDQLDAIPLVDDDEEGCEDVEYLDEKLE